MRGGMIWDEKRKTGTKGLGTKGLTGCPEVRSFPSSRPGFSKRQRRKCRPSKLLQRGPLFARNWQKRPAFWPNIGGFPGFLFNDEYTVAIGHVIFFVHLTLIATPQKAGF